ncbi:hypothetical protein AQ505_09805 [Pedobacter sp. PACM 27299]|uniref:hypothetical protein n=1 Tax=Pedobacter sp. PACM 27299 TaxID=1727164 RepID=UPI0007062276|nr:hypothetical protein [Pedobacter sp. PACM 27299]ALL05760.1 hypothetical protein AQ505_09805 [Pedobacter sp. PACM 27299]
MKKIIFSLFIAMIACLSATYVSANKTDSDYFYGLTDNGIYKRIYENYDASNCVQFNYEGICGYGIIPGVWAVFPYSISRYDIQYWIDSGYLRPISYNKGVYIGVNEW